MHWKLISCDSDFLETLRTNIIMHVSHAIYFISASVVYISLCSFVDVIQRATVWDTAYTTEMHLTFEGQEDSWSRSGWQGRQRAAVDRDSWEHRHQKGPQHQSPGSLHDHFIQRPTRDLFGPAWEGREEGGEDPLIHSWLRFHITIHLSFYWMEEKGNW